MLDYWYAHPCQDQDLLLKSLVEKERYYVLLKPLLYDSWIGVHVFVLRKMTIDITCTYVLGTCHKAACNIWSQSFSNVRTWKLLLHLSRQQHIWTNNWVFEMWSILSRCFVTGSVIFACDDSSLCSWMTCIPWMLQIVGAESKKYGKFIYLQLSLLYIYVYLLTFLLWISLVLLHAWSFKTCKYRLYVRT